MTSRRPTVARALALMLALWMAGIGCVSTPDPPPASNPGSTGGAGAPGTVGPPGSVAPVVTVVTPPTRPALLPAVTLPANPNLTTIGTDGWHLASTADVPVDPALVSDPAFAPDRAAGWLPVRADDAGAPGTVIAALLQQGECPDVARGENLKTCFGFQAQHGAVTTPRFAVPWLYRTELTADLRPGDHAELVINGIVGEADVWLNGVALATRSTVRGAFAKVELDITSHLRAGANGLVLRVHPNDPTTMFTLNHVDWNPIPPDNNTGIRSPIQLHVDHGIGLVDAHVNQANAADLSVSELTVSGVVTNHGAAEATVEVRAQIEPLDAPDPPAAGGAGAPPIDVRTSLTLAPGEVRKVLLTPADFPPLRLDRPAVWWPYQLGSQPLYRLTMAVGTGGPTGPVSDRWIDTFGIRTVTSYLTPPTALAPQGLRGFAVNGRRLLIRGAGWTQDLFLRYDAANIRDQVAMIRDLGLNAVRTEGHEMPDDFYRQLDRAGILIDAGFQCCMTKWGPGFDEAAVSEDDLGQLDLAARSIGMRLRNHPAIFKYGWSDFTPTPRMEAVGLRAFAEVDFREPIISSALYRTSAILGPAGEKEGPYDWVPPVYWYDDEHGDDGTGNDSEVFANVGGAWGYDSEASAGHTIPTRDSIDRFLTPDEQRRLWTEPGANQYHANTDTEVGNFKFGTLFHTATALAARYGPATDLDDFVAKGQLLNYESTRAQFEAYVAHTDNQPNPATGLIYWQLSKGFPSLLWTLYNNDFDTPGAYFGAKKANEPVHVFFDEARRTVGIDNLGAAALEGLTVEATVHTLDGAVADTQRVDGLRLDPLAVHRDVLTPLLPAATVPPAPAVVSFLELTLRHGPTSVSRNVYWLSSQADVIDWPATSAKSFATMLQRADLTALAGLPAATLGATSATDPTGGPEGRARTTVTITNTSTRPVVGFFLRADVRRGRDGAPLGGDDQVRPVRWSDNDITLWPGQSQTLTADFDAAALDGSDPVVTVQGHNVERLVARAG